MDRLVSLAAGLGFILSAETLVLLGNGSGRGGIGFMALILAASALHLWVALTVFSRPAGPEHEVGLLKQALGGAAAVILPLASRAATAVMMATGLLATAGFVFNEVFVYWFPNFLFAFLILGLILFVNLAGKGLWRVFQLLVVLTALAGLAVLVIAGIFSAQQPAEASTTSLGAGAWLQLGFSAVLVLVGYDLALFSSDTLSGKIVRSPAGAVLLGGLVLILWGGVSQHWVPSGDLAETTIPYTVAARAILGQGGRVIMGIVILAGTGGAVNAAFGGVTRMITGMSNAGLLPVFLGNKRFKGRIPVLLLTAASAILLFSGMAGSSHFDAYLRGGLILWLIHYAALLYGKFIMGLRTDPLCPAGVIHGVGGLMLGGVATGLLLTAENTGVTAAFMVVVAGAVLILILLWNGLNRTRNSGQ